MKTFVKDVAGAFQVSAGATQVGLVLYCTKATLSIPFGSSLDAFKDAVDDLKHQRGSIRIDRALQLAHSQLFTVKRGGRAGAQKICLVITDGKQTKTEDAVELSEAVRPLKVRSD